MSRSTWELRASEPLVAAAIGMALWSTEVVGTVGGRLNCWWEAPEGWITMGAEGMLGRGLLAVAEVPPEICEQEMVQQPEQKSGVWRMGA